MGAQNYMKLLSHVNDAKQYTEQGSRSRDHAVLCIRTLGGWGSPLWEFKPLPRLGSRPSPKPHPALSISGFHAAPALGTEATEDPKLLLNQGARPQSLATPLATLREVWTHLRTQYCDAA